MFFTEGRDAGDRVLREKPRGDSEEVRRRPFWEARVEESRSLREAVALGASPRLSVGVVGNKAVANPPCVGSTSSSAVASLAGVGGYHVMSSEFDAAPFVDGVAGHQDFLPISVDPLAAAGPVVGYVGSPAMGSSLFQSSTWV